MEYYKKKEQVERSRQEWQIFSEEHYTREIMNASDEIELEDPHFYPEHAKQFQKK